MQVRLFSTSLPLHTFDTPRPLMLGKWTRPLGSCSSPASRTLKARSRSESTHVRISRGDDLGPTRDDAHRTLRVRKDGKEKELPLSPLLDPVVLGNRSRWETIKAQPKAADFTPFQKKLQANPYGTPLRFIFRESMLRPTSACFGITTSTMSRHSHLASSRIPHVSACSSTSYYPGPVAPPSLTHYGRETPRTSLPIHWASLHCHPFG